MNLIRQLLLLSLFGSVPVLVQAEIRYIGMEDAEEIRLCLLYKNKFEQTQKDLRDATVAGGSAAGSTMEANAKRTKLRFQRDFYQRKIAENCTDVDTESSAAAAVEAATETDRE